jgi:Zn-dependent protease with chaperone function
MSISSFFNSYLGMYIAQSVCHSLISAIIVDRSLQSWKITNPVIRQRFSFIVILFPIFSFPIYQIINPERGSISFRLEALFDINRWLNLELWGKFPMGVIFIFILSLTAFVFFLQELIPILRHALESKKSGFEGEEPDKDSIVKKALESLPVKMPDIFIINDNDFLLFSGTGKNASIILSTGLVDVLNKEQIQAALAHEIAHIERSKRPLILMIFFLRVLMFFNPVILIEFRKIVQEDEKICDDIAVSLTQKPHALAETLRKLYYTTEKLNPIRIGKLSNLRATLDEYSHNLLIESRIARLEEGSINKGDREWFKFSITLIVIMIINYFVV